MAKVFLFQQEPTPRMIQKQSIFLRNGLSPVKSGALLLDEPRGWVRKIQLHV